VSKRTLSNKNQRNGNERHSLSLPPSPPLLLLLLLLFSLSAAGKWLLD
jgi:hypothetical protein